MAWTNTQKQLLARACTAACMNADQRHLVLGQCGNRAMHQGKLTSTSPKLTNEDFEICMAVAESASGGQVPFGGYSRGYWQGKADDGPLGRLRYRIKEIALQLAAGDAEWSDADSRLLQWINHSRIVPQHVAKLSQLDYGQLRKVLDGLTAYAKRRGVTGRKEAA